MADPVLRTLRQLLHLILTIAPQGSARIRILQEQDLSVRG